MADSETQGLEKKSLERLNSSSAKGLELHSSSAQGLDHLHSGSAQGLDSTLHSGAEQGLDLQQQIEETWQQAVDRSTTKVQELMAAGDMKSAQQILEELAKGERLFQTKKTMRIKKVEEEKRAKEEAEKKNMLEQLLERKRRAEEEIAKLQAHMGRTAKDSRSEKKAEAPEKLGSGPVDNKIVFEKPTMATRTAFESNDKPATSTAQSSGHSEVEEMETEGTREARHKRSLSRCPEPPPPPRHRESVPRVSSKTVVVGERSLPMPPPAEKADPTMKYKSVPYEKASVQAQRTWRNGDWICPRCRFHCFVKQWTCPSCHLSYTQIEDENDDEKFTEAADTLVQSLAAESTKPSLPTIKEPRVVDRSRSRDVEIQRRSGGGADDDSSSSSDVSPSNIVHMTKEDLEGGYSLKEDVEVPDTEQKRCIRCKCGTAYWCDGCGLWLCDKHECPCPDRSRRVQEVYRETRQRYPFEQFDNRYRAMEFGQEKASEKHVKWVQQHRDNLRRARETITCMLEQRKIAKERVRLTSISKDTATVLETDSTKGTVFSE